MRRDVRGICSTRARKEIGLDFLYLTERRGDDRWPHRRRLAATAKERLADHRVGAVGRDPCDRHRHLRQ